MAGRTAFETVATIKTLAPAITPVTALAAHLVFVGLDNPNGNTLTLTGQEIIYIKNAHVTDPGTITLTMRSDEAGRSGAITAYAIAAGAIARFRPCPVDVWGQPSTACLNIDCSSGGTMQMAVDRIG